MISKQELIEAIASMNVVRCTLGDGDTFNIGTADYWIGGTENGFMCDLLGNVEYSSAISVVEALFAYLDELGEMIQEIDF